MCVCVCVCVYIYIYIYNYYVKILNYRLTMELFRIKQLVLKLGNNLTVGYDQQVHNTTAMYN